MEMNIVESLRMDTSKKFLYWNRDGIGRFTKKAKCGKQRNQAIDGYCKIFFGK